MRIVAWTLLLALSTVLVAGCNSGDAPAPEDDAFQKQLADAAAKDKDKYPDSRAKDNKLKAPSASDIDAAKAKGDAAGDSGTKK